MSGLKVKVLKACYAVLIASSGFASFKRASGLSSYETGFTISKVRAGIDGEMSFIAGSSYEGTVLRMEFDGTVVWTNALSGFMNQDLWCEDLTGDGVDEILAANADGSVYCLEGRNGDLLWQFRKNEAPMNAVCAIHLGGKTYVTCGGYDANIYYLSTSGELLKTIPSNTYSIESPWHPYSKPTPADNTHTANFIRPVGRADGTEILAVHGVCHTMALQARGSVYLFEPMTDKPYSIINLVEGRPLGEMRTGDIDGDGDEEILMGGTGLSGSHNLMQIDIDIAEQRLMDVMSIGQGIESFGYRVVQPEVVTMGEETLYFVLFGSRLLLIPPSMNPRLSDVLACRYSFNDLWKDSVSQKLIFASSQSGGSCIHVLDVSEEGWEESYQALQPPGKIAAILKNTAAVWKGLDNFRKPSWQRDNLPVYLMTERITESVSELVEDIKANANSPVFLDSSGIGGAENWDRSDMDNDRYRLRRDSRRSYRLSQEEIVQHFVEEYANSDVGLSYWGGHGNDPYMFQLDTWKQVLNRANGKKTVMVFPELEDHSHYFAKVLEDYFYPLAEHCRKTDAKIYVRTKHCFWQSNIYLPMWSRLLSGEFSDVFIPSMEETTDKSMELSRAARIGVWASGATDQWGSRCARDNPSFDRLRQHSHQMLPSHFLRTMVLHISSGAQYLNNFPVDQDYMSLLWELIAKGVLYVPKRSEIVSFSPVHLSMVDPDEHFMDESSNTKWTTFFEEGFEEENPYVFSRLNGSWPGAPVTKYDFSRYAAGVKDRRLNFLAPYENGLVLITPPQEGVYAAKGQPRGTLTEHLHPLYQNILKEYLTDGRSYYSSDGKKQYSADEFYKFIESDIKDSAEHLPLTVSGDVAWVVAPTSPTHLRLTLIDSGYLNPNDRTARVTFHTVKPKKIVDVLNAETFPTDGSSTAQIDVPCGMFRFIDVELSKSFFGESFSENHEH